MKKKFIQKNPVHPGRILYEDCLKPLRLTLSQAAEKLSIAKADLSAVINARTSISPVVAIRLSKAFNTTPRFWLNLQASYDLAQRRKNGKPYKRVKATI